jgi:hypothetical protein
LRALPDGCLAEPAPVAEAPDLLQADADQSVSSASDASGAALPDAVAAADLRPEPSVADAGKSAARALDVPARDASSLRALLPAQSAQPVVAAELYKLVAAPSAEQSCAEPVASAVPTAPEVPAVA